MNRIAVFIDGPSLHAACRQVGFDIDFMKLMTKLGAGGRVTGAYYYTAMIDDGGSQSVRPLVDWLAYNGFRVVTRVVKERIDDAGRRRQASTSLGVDLTVDMMRIAHHVGQIYLFSGNGAFRVLVEAVQQAGVHVHVVSTLSGSVVSDELRRQADQFIELSQWRMDIARERCGIDQRE